MTNDMAPLPIVKKVQESSYKLKPLTTRKKIYLVFNEALLSPYTLLEYLSQNKPEQPPPIIINDEEEYEIYELMDLKFVQNKLKYLVKWQGCPNQADWTWKPEDKILWDNKDEFHEHHHSAPWWVDNFKEKVMQDKNPNPEWLNGKIIRFNVEDSRKDTYLPLLPEHYAEMEKQNKTSKYQNYFMEDIEWLWFLNT